VRHGFRWWEVDINFAIIRLLSRFGVVWDLRMPPTRASLGKPLGVRAMSRQRGRAGVAGRIASWHGPSLVSPASLPGADHPACDLAIPPIHTALPRR
jgi:stearoyl-CoA desaturase (delta-9 desaturase)